MWQISNAISSIQKYFRFRQSQLFLTIFSLQLKLRVHIFLLGTLTKLTIMMHNSLDGYLRHWRTRCDGLRATPMSMRVRSTPVSPPSCLPVAVLSAYCCSIDRALKIFLLFIKYLICNSTNLHRRDEIYSILLYQQSVTFLAVRNT